MSPGSDPLRLRRIQAGDWTTVHEWMSTIQGCQYQAWGPNTEDETRSYVSGAVAAWDARPQRRYVWSAVAGGGVVGLGELNIHSRRFRQAEISYSVHIGHWGAGIATAIAVRLLRYGFERLGMHRIAATCDPRNLASAAVLRKSGMTYEGCMRQTMELRDGWRDSAMFSMLASEWDALPR